MLEVQSGVEEALAIEIQDAGANPVPGVHGTVSCEAVQGLGVKVPVHRLAGRA